jgi:pseudaminic acid biosynthesis-associated methylase
MLTEQEHFWKGPEGDEYTKRNADSFRSGRSWVFGRVLENLPKGASVIEFGANRGLNLEVIDDLRPDLSLSAVEVNGVAIEQLGRLGLDNAFHMSMLDWNSDKQYDLSLVMGVLIHVAPDDLPRAYDALYKASKRYILVAEYFNRTPVSIEYRGQKDRLWKRDFASDMLDRFPDLQVVDYQFVWRRDPVAPLDDVTWFLLEKPA